MEMHLPQCECAACSIGVVSLRLGERGKENGAGQWEMWSAAERCARAHSPHPRPRLWHPGTVSQLLPISLCPVVALAMNRRARCKSSEREQQQRPPPFLRVASPIRHRRWSSGPGAWRKDISLIHHNLSSLPVVMHSRVAARNERGEERESERRLARLLSAVSVSFFSLLLVALQLQGQH